uniref:(California timema) hypothetical protein n=1 Tax=Timema californicum TaxID=61474 RepID=A0A7R9P889_TIMCA|nr:unnamed protein product [Timema californicum]
MNYRPRTDCPNSDGTRDFLPLPAECSLSGVPSHGDPWATRDGEPVDKYEDFSLRSNSELSKEGHRKQKKKSRASKKNAMDLESFGHTERYVMYATFATFATSSGHTESYDLYETLQSLPRSFATVYEWMLSNQDSYKHLNKNNVFDMFLASQYLEIRELEDQCWCLMSMEDVCRGDVALKLFLKAMRKEIKEIADVMLPRIGEFFLPFVGKRKFLDLPLEELMILLCSDHLSVRCEMEVFMCGVRWLMHDWERRKKHALELMRCVRFGLITPWQLVDINRNPSNPEFLRVTSIPEVRALIEDGLSYSVMRQQRSEDPVVEQGITRLAFDVSHQRNWLPDPTDGRPFVLYVDFVQHLMKLCKRRRKKNSLNISHESCH